ncbi:MAG: putative glycoside hydrolase [archaeon]
MKRNKIYLYVGLVLVLMLISVLSLMLTNRSKDYDSPIKIAYPIYDAPYSSEDYKWLASHADLLIAMPSENNNLAQMKEINPKMIFLKYQFSGLVNESKDGNSIPGFSYIMKSHKEWLLKDINGKIVVDDYSNDESYAVFPDFANKEFQDYAFSQYLDLGNFDGIFLDVVNFETKGYYPQKLGTNENEYQIQFKSYLHALHSDVPGLLVLNAAGLIFHDKTQPWAGSNEDIYDQTYGISDGILEEAFVNLNYWNPDQIYQSKDKWERQIWTLEESGKQNKIYIAVAQNRGMDGKDSLFNAASYLLGAHENSYFLNLGRKGYRLQNYKDEYENFRYIYEAPLGKPLGARYFEDGVWRRDFENGYVEADYNMKIGIIYSR